MTLDNAAIQPFPSLVREESEYVPVLNVLKYLWLYKLDDVEGDFQQRCQ